MEQIQVHSKNISGTLLEVFVEQTSDGRLSQSTYSSAKRSIKWNVDQMDHLVKQWTPSLFAEGIQPWTDGRQTVQEVMLSERYIF